MSKRSRHYGSNLSSYARAQSKQVTDNLHSAGRGLYSDTYIVDTARAALIPLNHPTRGSSNNQRLTDHLTIESIHVRYWVFFHGAELNKFWNPTFRLIYENGTDYTVPLFTTVYPGTPLQILAFPADADNPGRFQELWYKQHPMAGSLWGTPTTHLVPQPPPDPPVEEISGTNITECVYGREVNITGLSLPQAYLENHPGGWSTSTGGLYFTWSDGIASAQDQYHFYVNIRVRYKEQE